MKSILLSAVAVLGLSVAVGCTTTTTDGGGGGGEGGSGTGGAGATTSNVTTTSGVGGGTVAPLCYDDAGALDAPGATTTVGQGVCASTQVDGFWTACFDDAATEEGCGTFSDDTANAACLDCILGTAPDGLSPVLFVTQDGSAYLNTFACQAAAMNLPQCGPEVSDLVFCAQTACSVCDDTEFSECIDWALGAEGICGELPLDAACEPILAAETLDPRCTGADFEARYTSMSNYICGPATGG
jgi:hypothetical protein